MCPISDMLNTRVSGAVTKGRIMGLGDHAKGKAQRLAKAGYAALACDLHGEGTIMTDMPAMMALLGELSQSPTRIEARAKAGLDALLGTGKVDAAKVA